MLLDRGGGFEPAGELAGDGREADVPLGDLSGLASVTVAVAGEIDGDRSARAERVVDIVVPPVDVLHCAASPDRRSVTVFYQGGELPGGGTYGEIEVLAGGRAVMRFDPAAAPGFVALGPDLGLTGLLRLTMRGVWYGAWSEEGAPCEVELEGGVPFVRCESGNELLLPFSCKRASLCPSCAARRRAQWADHLPGHVLPVLPYRQLVFTMPKVLRRILMREHPLLGELTRTAYRATRAFLAAQFPGVERGAPYFASAVHTFGSLGNVHPHAHALCSAGNP